MTSARAIVTVGWSALVWIALWGEASPANVLAGVAVGVLTAWMVPLGGREDVPRQVTIRPLAAVRFVFYFLWALLRASAVVAWEVVTPGSRIHQGIIEVPLRTRSSGIATVIGNAISLTPGTLTLEVARDPLRLYVHVLHLRDMDAVRAELGRLEDLALRAFDRTVPEGDTP